MSELKSNQKIVGKNGGARPGAGRPKGSTNKLKVTDFFTGEDKERVVQVARDFVLDAERPDKDMTKFLFEQLFGKATQKVAGDDEMDALKFIQIIKDARDN